MAVMLKALADTGFYNSEYLQHLPRSAAHAKLAAFAKARETGVSLTQPVARQQALHYYIPPGGLSGVWDYVVQNLRAPEFFDLADPVLLINAKNMKTMFREDTPQKLIQSFHARWESKTVFPNRSSEGTASTPHVYLWRQKCLEHIQSKFKMDVPRDGMKVSPYPWALLNDVGSMTLEPGKRHPLRFAGLIYSQFYSSTKEILDAAKTYPFADQSLEGLAVDPSLHKEWQREAKHFGCKWSAQKARQTYGSSKLRVAEGLTSALSKSFGVREEHRMTIDLLLQIGKHMEARGLINQPLACPTFQTSPHRYPPFLAIPTHIAIEYLRANVNKFAFGFEYSLVKDGGKTISPAAGQMALMFLQFLRASYQGFPVRRTPGMWIDISQPNNEPPRHGMGLQYTLAHRGYGFLQQHKIAWDTWLLRA
ncbi:hypothetical protein BDZ91DRAFT_853647 [Kalaharituber pfeilii]|nr:hypothetical protein BDZ91DRAFT_853647 [Kalaharituber pfeilii]